MLLNAHQNADAEKQRNQRGAAVTHERQRHAHHRQDTAHHAKVDEGVGEKDHRDRTRQQARKKCRGVGGNHQPAQDQPAIEQQQHEVAEEAEFLCVHCKNEIGMALGDELQMRLRTLQPAFAGEAAAAHRDGWLNRVKALAERVSGGVQESADAIFLIINAKVIRNMVNFVKQIYKNL